MPTAIATPSRTKTARTNQAPRPRLTPYLESAPEANGAGHRIALNPLPFRLGRCDAAQFVIPSSQISRVHAEIYAADGGLRVRDLGSTNGTFLNGRRIDDAPLRGGDILHFAHLEYRLVLHADEDSERATGLTTNQHAGKVPMSVFYCRPLLEELIGRRCVQTFFQPVVDLRTGETFGYEALGRGTHRELGPKPGELFSLADRFGLSARLSALFRAVAVEEAPGLPGRPVLFVNVHPAELSEPKFLDSLRDLREHLPSSQRLVVEIHEDTVANLTELQRIRRQLLDSGIMLAFDDFGAGQARLTELTESPPDFIKLNMSLIRDIHRSVARQKLLQGIVETAVDMGSQVVAEGIEQQEEADTCMELGCRLGQGFLFGYPGPVNSGEAPDTWRDAAGFAIESTQVEVMTLESSGR